MFSFIVDKTDRPACGKRSHRTGFSATDDIINKIIRRMLFFVPLSVLTVIHVFTVTVQTGLVTSVWAIIDLLLYLADVCGPFSCVICFCEVECQSAIV
jgi:hypothetical protein